jgi:adhesin transport system membrane fusion protein
MLMPKRSSQRWASVFTHQELRHKHLLLLTISSLTIAILIWAQNCVLEEVTRSDRAIVATSKQMQTIQSFDGGIVKELFVREGQAVQKGELLAEIESVVPQSQLEKNKIQLNALRLRAERLRAEMAEQHLVFDKDLLGQYPQQAENEILVYQMRHNDLLLKQKALQHEILQAQAQMQQLLSEQDYTLKMLDFRKKEHDMVETLHRSGSVSPLEYLHIQRALTETQGLLAQIDHRKSQIEEHQHVLEQRASELLSSFQKEVSAEYYRTCLEIQQLIEEGHALEDRQQRTQLRSPVDGIVHRKYLHTQGAVLRPGDPLFDVVPTGDRLIFEVKISPKDIGFIHTGMPAHIKLNTYDFSVYGGLDGVVEYVSPDIMYDRESSYYLVRLATEKSYLERHGKIYPIIPGMTASVDIRTGKRTVMDYWLKPLLKAQQRALTER